MTLVGIDKGIKLKELLSILLHNFSNGFIKSNDWIDLNMYSYYVFLLRKKNISKNKILELIKNDIFTFTIADVGFTLFGISAVYTISISASLLILKKIDENFKKEIENQMTPLEYDSFLDLAHNIDNKIIKERIESIKLKTNELIA